jgi:hypothetical protein
MEILFVILFAPIFFFVGCALLGLVGIIFAGPFLALGGLLEAIEDAPKGPPSKLWARYGHWSFPAMAVAMFLFWAINH